MTTAVSREREALMSDSKLTILGARVHNLKNVDVEIPRHSLTVITGLSGSGKSSLAFDTIYAEGQRRYIETFSAYARNFLGNMERPDVDQISGLSPVISIEQKTTNKNPRSTVGTTTEIYDFLRLLFARAGEAFSYVSGEPMAKYTEEQIVHLIIRDFASRKICILSPLVHHRKGHYRELFESVRRKGYLYVRVDGEMCEIVPEMKLDRYRNHDIEVVIDRLCVQEKDEARLAQTVAVALKQGDGLLQVLDTDTSELRHYSKRLMCPTSGISYRDPAPHNFSFNSPQGACPRCKGLGYASLIDPDKVFPDRSLSVKQGGVAPLGKSRQQMIFWQIDALLQTYGCTLDTPLSQVPDEALSDIINGSDERLRIPSSVAHTSNDLFCEYDGLAKYISQMQDHDMGVNAQRWAEQFSGTCTCPECGGARLNREALHFRIAGKNIAQLSAMDLSELYEWVSGVEEQMAPQQRRIASEILKEIRTRLRFLLDVGLDYLSLSRSSATLSGGESQRIRLATQIGSQLVGVLYIQGTYKDMLKADTLTSRYLRGVQCIEVPAVRRPGNGHVLTLKGARGNNLKGVDATFPLGCLICVTGVSGSGKSTLIGDTLQPLLSQHFYRSLQAPLPYDAIEGLEYIDKVVSVDQSPLGRTPRSNPATYTGIFNDIRSLFVELPEAKIRGYKPGRFSFNVKGGRCEACGGNGYRTIEMNFLPDVLVPCQECQGKRYNRETLEVRFRGKSIADVLDMTINQAVEFFENQPSILKRIKVLQDVGLGYIKLGQPSTTLSGGESQRVKLATELGKKDTGKTLYILDEPTTGLHFEDIRVLLSVLNRLVDKGNTVVVIEHNLDVVKSADWLIDMGPGGGREGGRLVFSGTPEQLAQSDVSVTAPYLKAMLTAQNDKKEA